MFHIKRLYTFMLQTFIPVLCMTFFICLFIVLMQFVWKYVDDMAGKGLDVSVLAELFFYAAVSFVPMALPLAILLASLMTFGNLGERLELLAMKASGVSLIKIMRPLILVVALIAVGAFYFQNKVLPIANVKLFSLLYSMRQKSPEVDIPKGIFYKEISGYNLYIKDKDHKTGMLYDVMIYDISKSFEDAAVIVADSGKLKMADNKESLVLTLYHGESFENLKDQRTSKKNVPYRRESFSMKEIIIDFDANFNRVDESIMQNKYVGKNMDELRETLDTLTIKRDSVSRVYASSLQKTTYFNGNFEQETIDSIIPSINAQEIVSFEEKLSSSNPKQQQEIYSKALSKANAIKQDFEFKDAMQKEENKNIRRHQIEIHKKFTLSLACLVFFFIGAPLGAIIRKGGLGMPVIISVLLFIFYYIVDNVGFKMARDGQWPIWQGIWLSTGILLFLGVFFTYKAVNDSVLFNMESYSDFFRNVIGLRKKRTFIKKEVVIETLGLSNYKSDVEIFNNECLAYLSKDENPKSYNFYNFCIGKYQSGEISDIVVDFNIILEKGSNAVNQEILNVLSEYPYIYKMKFGSLFNNKTAGIIFMIIFPVSLAYYIFAMFKRAQRIKILKEVILNNDKLISVISQILSK